MSPICSSAIFSSNQDFATFVSDLLLSFSFMQVNPRVHIISLLLPNQFAALKITDAFLQTIMPSSQVTKINEKIHRDFRNKSLLKDHLVFRLQLPGPYYLYFLFFFFPSSFFKIFIFVGLARVITGTPESWQERREKCVCKQQGEEGEADGTRTRAEKGSEIPTGTPGVPRTSL